MEGILGRFAPQIYALLRIVSGLLFAVHGAQKLLGVLGGQQVPIMSQFGLAGVIELWRTDDCGGGVRQPGGVCCQRRDGRRVLSGARPQSSVACAERW
jgi:hypothetical protein